MPRSSCSDVLEIPESCGKQLCQVGPKREREVCESTCEPNKGQDL